MPTDEEVRSAFIVKDVYNFRSRNYLLRQARELRPQGARSTSTATRSSTSCRRTRTCRRSGRRSSGPTGRRCRRSWLHTIGNLTLTGYNPELSDRPFREKLTMKGGFRDSPLRLNHYLAAARPLERGGDPEAGASSSPTWRSRSGRRRQLPEETLAKYRKTKAKAAPSTRSTTTRRLPVRSARSSTSCASASTTSTPASTRRSASSTSPTSWRRTSSRSSRWPTSSSSTSTSRIDELDDPRGLGRDVTAVGHWGTGSVEVRLADADQLEDVMALVRQSFERQGEEGYEEPQWSQAGVERVVERGGRPGGAGGAARRSSKAPCGTASTRGRGSAA